MGCPLFDLLVTRSFLATQRNRMRFSNINSLFVAPMYKSCTLNKPDGLALSSAVCRIP
jgi:hypothetical protein